MQWAVGSGQWAKSRLVVNNVAGVYEVKSEVTSHVTRIMPRTMIVLAITTQCVCN
jgi:hypothetical protein